LEIIETDILVIGGGAAGCMASIAAKNKNPELDVTLLEKTCVKRGGSVGRGMDHLNYVVVPGIGTLREYIDFFNVMTEKILDQNLIYILGKESFNLLKKLENWGVIFPKDEKGNYLVRGKFFVEMRGDLKSILFQKVLSHGVKVIERTMATSLLTQGNRVVGATALNVRSGEFFVYKAKATVLTAGSAARFGLPKTGYLFGTFDCPSCAGDGYSLAFRAGAELMNMECTRKMFMIKDFAGPAYSFLHYGCHLINALGERFMERYGGKEEPSYLTLWAMWREMSEGRAPIYMRFSHLPDEVLERIMNGMFTVERPTIKEFFSSRGIDLKRDDVEITLSGPVLCGGHGFSGLVINEKAETSLVGLYAAGDVVALGGCLPGALIFGEIAGRNAAKYASSVPMPEIDKKQIESERNRVFMPLESKGDIPPRLLEFKLRRIINEYIDSPKSERKLKTALYYISRFKKDLLRLKADDPHQLMRALEVHFILDCAEMSALASLARQESRWGIFHYRIDYPSRDDRNWQKFLILKLDKKTKKIQILTKPAPIKLKRGVLE